MNSIYPSIVKVGFDLVASIVMILVFSPILLLVSILVYVNLGTPIIYKQARPGLNEVPFFLFKFRTMTNAKSSNGELLPNEDRLSRFGKILRSSSLDELPSLFNVLRGDLSLVGPRPLRMRYLPYYTEEEKMRHNVKPGLTGLAQVNGRNSIDWERKLHFDIQYVQNLSFKLDLLILVRTIIKVIFRKDVTPGHRNFEVPLDEIRNNNNE